MTSILLLEKEATINIVGGSTHSVTITKVMQDLIGVDFEKDKVMIGAFDSDKHGRFISIYCPEKQKQQIKQRIAQDKQQAKL
jgi:hypothetical protein